MEVIRQAGKPTLECRWNAWVSCVSTKSSYRFITPGYWVWFALGGLDCRHSTARIYSSRCETVISCLELESFLLKALRTTLLLTILASSQLSQACSHGYCSSWRDKPEIWQAKIPQACRPHREGRGNRQTGFIRMLAKAVGSPEGSRAYRLRLKGFVTGPASAKAKMAPKTPNHVNGIISNGSPAKNKLLVRKHDPHTTDAGSHDALVCQRHGLPSTVLQTQRARVWEGRTAVGVAGIPCRSPIYEGYGESVGPCRVPMNQWRQIHPRASNKRI